MRVVGSMVIVMNFAAVLGAQTAMLPKDIDPQSFSRLPPLTRDDMKDEDSKRIYDMLAGGPDKTVTPTGPAAISLYSPKVAEAIQIALPWIAEAPGLRGGRSGGRAGVRSAIRVERPRNGCAARQSPAGSD